jgi:hypothetical protein
MTELDHRKYVIAFNGMDSLPEFFGNLLRKSVDRENRPGE